MRILFWVVCLAIAPLGMAPLVQADNSPLLINIDNPQFRKMVIAIPSFAVDPRLSQNPAVIKLEREGATRLRYLLDYTNLFESMADAAFSQIIDQAQKLAKPGEPAQVSSNEQMVQWKALGVESLTTGVLLSVDGGINLELRTWDVQRQKLVLGKRYSKLKEDEMAKIIRRYANLLMELYTGRPGVFSSKIAFIGKRNDNDFKQVYVCDFDGSNVTQITSTKATKISPHWSPDGRYLTYTSFERHNPDLFMYDFTTKRKQIISNYQGINSGAQWAPSGKVLAYTGSKDGDTDIFLLDPFRGVRTKLIRGNGLDVDPAFSPDGKQLAFVSGRYGNPHIFLGQLEWQHQSQAKVTNDQRLTYAGWYNSTPAWSPDSNKIIFAGYDRDIDRYDIFMMNRDGKQLERLTLKTGDNESPSFAPNGLLIAFQSNRIGEANVKGRPQIWVMGRDGSNQHLLNTGLYEAQTPAWSHKLYE